ncbi:hypothetical protein P152DRAFT_53926 [Eremomyces bilateralis CBS 781.70]|uniref:Uncharacterized protein n=1 Tax=Eremomyces bilateralis CBS 781.70 TaxID=1392243 RepID=A0A6G1G0G2_9PEZI|nr:uncharacterized protein P152DRAFT_53926 [Eremomyces bilateralis CBS 781.70]KAF1811410.1 hypothetical protein P152DRAFT_53926 [Eremomyces bilateralis CBS 781.70]
MPDGPVAVDSHPRLSGIMDTVNATFAHGGPTKLPSEFYGPKLGEILDKVAVEEWNAVSLSIPASQWCVACTGSRLPNEWTAGSPSKHTNQSPDSDPGRAENQVSWGVGSAPSSTLHWTKDGKRRVGCWVGMGSGGRRGQRRGTTKNSWGQNNK